MQGPPAPRDPFSPGKQRLQAAGATVVLILIAKGLSRLGWGQTNHDFATSHSLDGRAWMVLGLGALAAYMAGFVARLRTFLVWFTVFVLLALLANLVTCGALLA